MNPFLPSKATTQEINSVYFGTGDENIGNNRINFYLMKKITFLKNKLDLLNYLGLKLYLHE